MITVHKSGHSKLYDDHNLLLEIFRLVNINYYLGAKTYCMRNLTKSLHLFFNAILITSYGHNN